MAFECLLSGDILYRPVGGKLVERFLNAYEIRFWNGDIRLYRVFVFGESEKMREDPNRDSFGLTWGIVSGKALRSFGYKFLSGHNSRLSVRSIRPVINFSMVMPASRTICGTRLELVMPGLGLSSRK